jgi:hypothetical protein
VRRKKIWLVFIAAFIAAVAAGIFFFINTSAPEKKQPPKKDFSFAPVKMHEVAIALFSMPDAVSYRVSSGAGEKYDDKFSLFGLEKDEKSPVDILFVGSDKIFDSKKIIIDWNAILKRVAPYGEIVLSLDVKEITAKTLKDFLLSIPWKNVDVWIVGEHNWVVVVREKKSNVQYSSILNMFLLEEAFNEFCANGIDVPWSVLSSYAGTIEDVMPAFVGNLETKVYPECFFSREVKKIPWIEKGESEDDIYSAFLDKVQSAGIARRIFLEGNALSRSPTSVSLEKAISKWQEAYSKNKRDVMINERLYQLAVNALAFSEIGNLKGAAKCYETMISINPENPEALRKYASVMRKLGRKEIALVAERKANEYSNKKK